MPTIPPNPDWFVYDGPIISKSEAYPIVTGTVFSSLALGTWHFNAIVFPTPVAFNKINVFKNIVPATIGATSQASTGSAGYSYQHNIAVFKRQDWGSNSTNLSHILNASAGITATVGYSSTSQQFGLSWNTDATGGLGTVTTTSNNQNWSAYAGQFKLLAIPVSGDNGSGTTLSAGEYFFAHQNVTSSATSNSNIELLDTVQNLILFPQDFTFGVLGSTAASVNSAVLGLGHGLASTITTSTTFAESVISRAIRLIIQNFSNA